MATFWQLMKESVILQFSVTIILVVTVCYMYVTGKVVPQFLMDATLFALGFTFGGKVENIKARQV